MFQGSLGPSPCPPIYFRIAPYQWWGIVKQCPMRRISTRVFSMFSKTFDFHDLWAQGPWAYGTLMPIGILRPINDENKLTKWWKQIDRFYDFQLLSPNAKCWTNYLRHGSAISSYGPCGQFGSDSLFKTLVNWKTKSDFCKSSNCIELPIGPVIAHCIA